MSNKLRAGQKIKLKSVEELLGVTNEESALDIEIVKIRPFKDHPFKVVDDEKMHDLVESIRANGILSPVLIRPIGFDRYEMVSGHRRMHAAKLLGMERLPSIIRDMTDEEATVRMVDSNIQREELLPSEKAFAYKMKMEAMKRQGFRSDLGYDGTSGQNDQKLLGKVSRDILAEEMGESSKQIQRYIRLTELIPELLDYVDQKRIQFTVAVEISYIEPEIQRWLYAYIRDNGIVKLNQISILRTELQAGAMTEAKMITLLNNSQPGKLPSSKLTFTEKKLREYFPPEYTTTQMRNVIEKLLGEWKQTK